MKTNKEFINGIYEKYDEYLKEKKKRKQINIKRMVNMAAVVIILFSAIIVLSERKETQVPQTIVSNEGAKQDKVNLETVGNFENFYKVIKERYNSDSMLEGESELILEDSTTNAERDSETKNSKTNTQVNNVDEADIVKVDGNYIYYVSNKKLVIIDAHTPEASEKISEINYKDTNFNPREVYVKGQKIIVIGNEYDNSCKTEAISTEDVTATDIERVQESKPKSGMRIYDISNIKGEWIVPANPKYYDIINAFNKTDTIIWKQSNNIWAGDIVYLYAAAPISAILYKCEVLETDIPYEYKDKNVAMKKVMKIKLLKRYKQDKFTFEKLNKYGIKWVRGPRGLTDILSKDLNL